MKTITSRANPGFRLLKDVVGGSRERRKHNAVWLEGEKLCAAYVSGTHKAQALVVSDALDVEPFVGLHSDKAHDIWVVHAALYREITQLETGPGWGLLIEEPKAAVRPGPCDLVIFDRVQDPGNLGSMLRSAAAAGFDQAWCAVGTVDPWTSKVMRAAMGAHFAIDVVVGLEEAEIITHAKSQGIALLATANRKDAVSLYSNQLSLAKPCAWIFGQEGEGVSEAFLSASIAVVIPQSPQVESLNVAAAASVCLFETKRHRLAIRP